MSSTVAYVPLFDRLTDLEPHRDSESPPAVLLDRRGLEDSVQRDLERLLNSRARTPAALLADRPERTTIDYGVAGDLLVSPGDPAQYAEIGARLAATIAAYEPRLQDVTVEVAVYRPESWRFEFQISGRLVSDGHAAPVFFTVPVE